MRKGCGVSTCLSNVFFETLFQHLFEYLKEVGTLNAYYSNNIEIIF